MKIALVGAPGSGKRDLASDLYRALKWKTGEQVVGNYEAKLQEAGIPVGRLATWHSGLLMHAEQYRQEFSLRRDGVSFIATGTDIERVAHAGIRYMQIVTSPDEGERKASDADLVGTEILAALLVAHWDYDHAFYLPPPSSSNMSDADAQFALDVDYGIREALRTFEIPVLDLTGSMDTYAEQVLTIIKQEAGENDRRTGGTDTA